jgi:hypothetical protein
MERARSERVVLEVAMGLIDGFTNWVRGRMMPARTTSQMLADLESEDLIGTERRRGSSTPEPLPATHPPGRPSGARPREERE